MEQVTPATIKNAINEIKPDILHCHDFTASLFASLVTKKIPIISHLHHNSPWLKKVNLKSIMYFFSVPRYSKVLAVSNSIFDDYVFSKRIKQKIVIGNIVNIKKYLDNNVDVPVNLNTSV